MRLTLELRATVTAQRLRVALERIVRRRTLAEAADTAPELAADPDLTEGASGFEARESPALREAGTEGADSPTALRAPLREPHSLGKPEKEKSDLEADDARGLLRPG